MAFKPIVHEVEIEDGGESQTFFIREASALEVLQATEEAKNRKKPLTSTEGQMSNFDFLCIDKSGAPLPPDARKELLGIRFSAMQKINDAIVDKSGLRTAAKKKGDGDKEGEEKNA